jgi:hypothetical protein
VLHVIAGLFISGFLFGAAVGIARRHLSPPIRE